MFKFAKEFVTEYIGIYKRNFGTVLGTLGAPVLYSSIGRLLNLPQNDIIYGMLVSAAVGAVFGHKYLNRFL
jgi:hypothetical protein